MCKSTCSMLRDSRSSRRVHVYYPRQEIFIKGTLLRAWDSRCLWRGHARWPEQCIFLQSRPTGWVPKALGLLSCSSVKNSLHFHLHLHLHLNYPLTAGVGGALQMTSQPVSSTFLCSPLHKQPQHEGNTAQALEKLKNGPSRCRVQDSNPWLLD